MKEVNTNMYVVVNPKGKPELFTLQKRKTESINTFENANSLGWEDHRKIGYKCIKVDVQIMSSSYFY